MEPVRPVSSRCRLSPPSHRARPSLHVVFGVTGFDGRPLRISRTDFRRRSVASLIGDTGLRRLVACVVSAAVALRGAVSLAASAVEIAQLAAVVAGVVLGRGVVFAASDRGLLQQPGRACRSRSGRERRVGAAPIRVASEPLVRERCGVGRADGGCRSRRSEARVVVVEQGRPMAAGEPAERHRGEQERATPHEAFVHRRSCLAQQSERLQKRSSARNQKPRRTASPRDMMSARGPPATLRASTCVRATPIVYSPLRVTTQGEGETRRRGTSCWRRRPRRPRSSGLWSCVDLSRLCPLRPTHGSQSAGGRALVSAWRNARARATPVNAQSSTEKPLAC